MEKLIEHMIQVVESNAKNNQATIPDVESWSIAWREEAAKLKGKKWSEIWREWIAGETAFGAVNFFEYLESNYEPPVKKESVNREASDK